MRKIKSDLIGKKVYEAIIKASFSLRPDVLNALKAHRKKETFPRAKKMLDILIDNAAIAESKKLPICQDTGMVCVFCRIGQKIIIDGDINLAINKAVAAAYKQFYLRKSIVKDPIIRNNTKNNTPAAIHYDFVDNNKIKIEVMLKGFGSENSSFTGMLNPTSTPREIENFIVENVSKVASGACPPLILGIGMGGTLDLAAVYAKKALFKKINTKNNKKHLYMLEKNIINKLNRTNIGPMALGGKTTCVGASIISYPTHIAGLPVCVNVSCHALRTAEAII